jgi:hypothetical protein
MEYFAQLGRIVMIRLFSVFLTVMMCFSAIACTAKPINNHKNIFEIFSGTNTIVIKYYPENNIKKIIDNENDIREIINIMSQSYEINATTGNTVLPTLIFEMLDYEGIMIDTIGFARSISNGIGAITFKSYSNEHPGYGLSSDYTAILVEIIER